MEHEMEALGPFKEDIGIYYPNTGDSNGKEQETSNGNWGL